MSRRKESLFSKHSKVEQCLTSKPIIFLGETLMLVRSHTTRTNVMAVILQSQHPSSSLKQKKMSTKEYET